MAWGLVWDCTDDYTDVGFYSEHQWGPVERVEQRSKRKVLAGSLGGCIWNRLQEWGEGDEEGQSGTVTEVTRLGLR